jgi:magnesium-transporting ATPase (P-type)
VVFDKTGTLTTGAFTIAAYNVSQVGSRESEVMNQNLSKESNSIHDSQLTTHDSRLTTDYWGEVTIRIIRKNTTFDVVDWLGYLTFCTEPVNNIDVLGSAAIVTGWTFTGKRNSCSRRETFMDSVPGFPCM